jgi:hypothetical protein
VIAVIGGTVLLIGLALLVLPGPGVLVIVLGLAILATEFAFAARWLRLAKQRARTMAEYAQRQVGAGAGTEVQRRQGLRSLRAGLRALEWTSTLLFAALLLPILIVLAAGLLGWRAGWMFAAGSPGYWAAGGVFALAAVLHLMGCAQVSVGLRRRGGFGSGLGLGAFLTGLIFAGSLAFGFFSPTILGGMSVPMQLSLAAALQINALIFFVLLAAILSHLEADPWGVRGLLGRRFRSTALALGIVAASMVVIYWWPRLGGPSLIPVLIGGWGSLPMALVYILFVSAIYRARAQIQAVLAREHGALSTPPLPPAAPGGHPA